MRLCTEDKHFYFSWQISWFHTEPCPKFVVVHYMKFIVPNTSPLKAGDLSDVYLIQDTNSCAINHILEYWQCWMKLQQGLQTNLTEQKSCELAIPPLAVNSLGHSQVPDTCPGPEMDTAHACLLGGLFLLGFPTKTLYTVFLCTTCYRLLDLTTLTYLIRSKSHEPLHYAVFLFPPVASSLLDQTIFFILFSLPQFSGCGRKIGPSCMEGSWEASS
jgi:hypothetical protein